MKKLLNFILFVLLASFNIYSQVPEKINYQAAVRNASGEIIANQSVDIRISIIDSIMDGDVLYRENQTQTTNDYGVVNIAIGDGESDMGEFSPIVWGLNSKYLKIEVDVGGGLVDLGTVQLLSVPYALYASSAANLGDEKVYSTSSDTLFVVKDNAGNVVFAVFPDGAQIFVDESAKGKIGGFAVSGRNPNKAELNDEFLRVTRDSTRVTFNQSSKGKVGGFAVSGRNPNKVGSTSSIINLFPDNYFIGDSAGINTTTGKFNTFFGYKAGKENTTGANNVFMGYKAGMSNETADNNVFIGKSIFQNSTGSSQNVAIGNSCASDVTSTVTSSVIMGDNALTGMLTNIPVSSSMFIGNNAGINLGAGSTNVSNCIFLGTNAGDGVKNTEYSSISSIVAVGNSSGSDSDGYRNVFIGNGAGSQFVGHQNTMIGFLVGTLGGSGTYNVYIGDQCALEANGDNNTYIGRTAGAWVNGSNNVFLGIDAGRAAFDSPRTESNRLRIGSSNLIYGEFDNEFLSLNGNVGVNRDAYSNVSLGVSPNGQNYGIYVDAGSISYAGYFNGDIHATGTSTSSDIRYKRNVKQIINPIDKIKGIRGVTYFWDINKFKDKGFTDKKQIGVIAQEIEEILPELVREDEKGYKAVSYDKLTAVLVEAVKEQQNKIDLLENENKELVERLKRLEELILK